MGSSGFRTRGRSKVAESRSAAGVGRGGQEMGGPDYKVLCRPQWESGSLLNGMKSSGVF